MTLMRVDAWDGGRSFGGIIHATNSLDLYAKNIASNKMFTFCFFFLLPTQKYILAQISKPPPSVCGNISGILKGTYMKFCINNNESMSYVSVKTYI